MMIIKTVMSVMPYTQVMTKKLNGEWALKGFTGASKSREPRNKILVNIRPMNLESQFLVTACMLL